MIESTTETVPGREITEILGIARGNSVRARHAGRDIMAGLRNLIGGEISEYASLQAETREMANRRMIAQAEEWGADAVVGVRVTPECHVRSGAVAMTAPGRAADPGKDLLNICCEGRVRFYNAGIPPASPEEVDWDSTSTYPIKRRLG